MGESDSASPAVKMTVGFLVSASHGRVALRSGNSDPSGAGIKNANLSNLRLWNDVVLGLPRGDVLFSEFPIRVCVWWVNKVG